MKIPGLAAFLFLLLIACPTVFAQTASLSPPLAQSSSASTKLSPPAHSSGSVAQAVTASPVASASASGVLETMTQFIPSASRSSAVSVSEFSPQPELTPLATPDPENVLGAKVMLQKKVLFEIYGSSSVYSAAERAEIISQRLEPLLEKIDDQPIEVVYQNRLAVLKRKQLTLMTITESDALLAQLSIPQLAEFYADSLRNGLRKGQIRFNMGTLILATVLAILLTLLLVGLLMLLWRLFPWCLQQVDQFRQRILPDIRIKEVVLFPSAKLSEAVHFVLNLLRNLVVLVLLYVYFPLLLSLFPWTRGYSQTLLTYITAPLGTAVTALVNYIPSLFIIVLIVVATYYLLKLIKLVFTAFDQGLLTYQGFDQVWAKPTYAIVRFLVIAFAVVVVFPYLPGSGSPAFQSVSLFLGVLFSLGSSSAIANMVSGVVLTYMSPFQIGDQVKIAETMGDVVEKGLLVTRIRTSKNVRITVPNSMILNSHIVNYSTSAKTEGLILHTTITIGYDVPWPQVHEALLTAAQRTGNTLKEPKPFVFQTALNDFYVAYELNVYTDAPHLMGRIYSDLHQHLQDTCNEAGIEIMSSHYSAVRDGNLSTQPAKYLPADYRTPGFRVETSVDPSIEPEEREGLS